MTNDSHLKFSGARSNFKWKRYKGFNIFRLYIGDSGFLLVHVILIKTRSFYILAHFVVFILDFYFTCPSEHLLNIFKHSNCKTV